MGPAVVMAVTRCLRTAAAERERRVSRRQEPVNVLTPGVRISSGCASPRSAASSVRFVLADQDGRETYGGPMTVVAGIIALLLLGYLVVALLNPERF